MCERLSPERTDGSGFANRSMRLNTAAPTDLAGIARCTGFHVSESALRRSQKSTFSNDCARHALCSDRRVAAAKRFEDLVVWQLTVCIRDGVHKLTETGGSARDFSFRDQIRDAASSAPRNIAEGFVRYNPPEFAHFMSIAKGSLGETQNHLLHGRERNHFSEQEFDRVWRLTCRALRAANRLHAYLRRCGRKKPGASGSAPRRP